MAYDQVYERFVALCQIYDQEFTSTKLWPAMYDQTTTKWPPAYDQDFLDQSCDQLHAMSNPMTNGMTTRLSPNFSLTNPLTNFMLRMFNSM